MKIIATPIEMSPAEAMAKARQGGNIFGKALYGSGEITLRLIYLESREVILNMYYQPAPLMKMLGKKPPTEPNKKIRMVVEGTRCGVSYSGEPIKVEEIEVDEGAVQNTEYSDDKIILEASRVAKRMVRRQIGKVVTTDLYKMRSVYRPFYVAFYGKMEMGSKVRYTCIAADGNRVERSL